MKPKVVPPLLEKITTDDVYIMDSGEYINIFIANEVNPRYIQDVSTTKKYAFSKKYCRLALLSTT